MANLVRWLMMIQSGYEQVHRSCSSWATNQRLQCSLCWWPWWRHQMETFSALLALCAGNSSVAGEFPSQRPVTRSFDVLFDLRLNERLSKQLWDWWFETPLRPLWRHCNDNNDYACHDGPTEDYATTTTLHSVSDDKIKTVHCTCRWTSSKYATRKSTLA